MPRGRGPERPPPPRERDDVDAEAGLRAAGGVSAAVVRREQLDVLVMFPAIDLVLDAVVGEMHLAIEVRQVVLARPVADLVLVAAGSAVAVRAVAVVVLQELLVLALQVLLEDDASDLEVSRARLGDGLPPGGTSRRDSSRGRSRGGD